MGVKKVSYLCSFTIRYALVWQEVTRVYSEMIRHEGWPTRSGETISVPAMRDLLLHVGLLTILSAGFGLPLPWEEGTAAKAKDSKLSLAEGIRLQAENLLVASWAPNWVYYLPFGK